MTATSIDALTRWAQFYWPAGMGQLTANDPKALREYQRTAAALRAAAAALAAHRGHPGEPVAFDTSEALAVADQHWPADRPALPGRDRGRVSVSVTRDQDVAAALRAVVAELET